MRTVRTVQAGDWETVNDPNVSNDPNDPNVYMYSPPLAWMVWPVM